MFNFEEEFKKLEDELLNFKLPRIFDLPDIDLYMDQVIKIVKGYLSPLEIAERKDNFITSSMVNNYVKLNVIPAPANKKYSAIHVCYLVVVCLLKHVFSINDIKAFLCIMNGEHLLGDKIERYNKLCEQFEESLKKMFVDNHLNRPTFEEPVPDSLVTYAIASKIYCEKIIDLKKAYIGEKKTVSVEELIEKTTI